MSYLLVVASRGMKRPPLRTKATFSLPRRLVERLEVAARSASGSKSALVEAAVESHLVALEAERLKEEYGQAAGDELFIADVEAVMADFTDADEDLGRDG